MPGRALTSSSTSTSSSGSTLTSNSLPNSSSTAEDHRSGRGAPGDALQRLNTLVASAEAEAELLAKVCAQYEAAVEARAAPARVKRREEVLQVRAQQRAEEAEAERLLQEAEALRSGQETKPTRHRRPRPISSPTPRAPSPSPKLSSSQNRVPSTTPKSVANAKPNARATKAKPNAGTNGRERPRRPRPQAPGLSKAKVTANHKLEVLPVPEPFDQTFEPVERPPDYGKLRKELASERQRLQRARRLFMQRAAPQVLCEKDGLYRIAPRFGGSDEIARDQEAELVRAEAKVLVHKLRELRGQSEVMRMPEDVPAQQSIEMIFPMWLQFNLVLERCEALKARADRLARLETEPALSEVDVHLMHFEDELLAMGKRAFKLKQGQPAKQVHELVVKPLRSDLERLATREVLQVLREAASSPVLTRDLREFAQFYRMAWRFAAAPDQDARVSFIMEH